ncbi:PREDICTED: uncharacterized protein LOC109115268 [Nelumbo nucifera]|uniref:Uncharacterized protein LOC109115268 n=1 Tax=Nelumbo nucifera TaxID=4432 RepID=A0A1U8Q990_NELNU|nr:PREDICTED: uncharacterized protein LOC109115268 [Nelumbo nucifera]
MDDIPIVALYVNDLVFIGNNMKMIEDFKNEMVKKYEMSDMVLLYHFLGIEIYQATPLVVNEKLMKEDDGKKVDETLYRNLAENLFYLTTTRSDIMFVVVLLSRVMNSPSHIHFGAAKRMLRYVKGTMDYGIKYDKGNSVKLVGFCDNVWGGCADDMKSTSSYCFSIGGGVFSWCSKKQKLVAQSSVELCFSFNGNISNNLA